MRTPPNSTAVLAMVATATVVSGALLALSAGSESPRAAYAVERTEIASVTVDEVSAPVAQLVERDTTASSPAPADSSSAFAVQLLVLDGATGLVVTGATVTLGSKVERFEPVGRLPLTLEVPRPGEPLLVAAAGFEPRIFTAEGEGPQEVLLSRRTALRGVVRNAHGAPLPHAKVQLIVDGDAANASPDAASPRHATLRRTDARGAFTFDALRPGTYRTAVEIAGVTHLSQPRELREGEWAEADHRLVSSSSLMVQVDGALGLPAERARLLVQRDDGEAPLTRYTDDRGRAEIRPLPAGSYQLTVQSDKGTSDPRSFKIKEGDQGLIDLRIQLSAAPLDPQH